LQTRSCQRSGRHTDCAESLDSCLLVPPADSHAIAVRIKQLAKDATRLTDLGKQARHVVEEKFSSERMVKQYASIYSL